MIRWKCLAILCLLPLTAAAGADPSGDDFERAMVQTHNAARAAAGVEPLAWDDNLAADAQQWADYLATSNRFEHSNGDRGSDPEGEGENLFMGTEGAFSYQQMVKAWVDEKKYFVDGEMPNLSTTGDWDDVGHYTQIIWRSTRRFGCALANNGEDDYLVCRYSEPGNFMGERPR